MSDLVHEFETVTLTIKRTATGSYVAGRFVPGVETTFPAIANVQNATPDETTMFPEGRRGGEIKVVYTETELKAPDESVAQTKGDIFDYKGNTYEVHRVEDWSDETDLIHFKVFALKQDDQAGADRG